MVTDLQSCWMQSYMNKTEPRKDLNSLDQFEFVNKQGQVFRLRSKFCGNMSCHTGTSFVEEKNIKENQSVIHLLENRHNNTWWHGSSSYSLTARPKLQRSKQGGSGGFQTGGAAMQLPGSLLCWFGRQIMVRPTTYLGGYHGKQRGSGGFQGGGTTIRGKIFCFDWFRMTIWRENAEHYSGDRKARICAT